jgi:polysaccharide biosynthesis transport protein
MDEVRKLVQRVFLVRGNGNAPRTVAFCGANRGAGTTWISARTGESLARESGANVCLIDANFRSPSLHTQFGVPNTAGFAEMVQAPRLATEFTQKISTNLSVITAGDAANGATAALNAQALARRVTELREAFDFLLIDTPAMDASSDAVLFGRAADGVVLVVASDSTRRETARNVKDSFETAYVPVLGAVLNKRTFPIPSAIYRKI